MDHLRQAGEAPEYFQHQKHSPYPGNIMARQGAQHWGAVLCRTSQHVHITQTTQTPLTRPRSPHARWSHSQWPPVRWAGLWMKTHRAAAATVPRWREVWHESHSYQHVLVGELGLGRKEVESHPVQPPQVRGGEAGTSCTRETYGPAITIATDLTDQWRNMHEVSATETASPTSASTVTNDDASADF